MLSNSSYYVCSDAGRCAICVVRLVCLLKKYVSRHFSMVELPTFLQNKGQSTIDEDVEVAAEAVFAHLGLDSRSGFLSEVDFITTALQNDASVLPGSSFLFRLAMSPLPGLFFFLFLTF